MIATLLTKLLTTKILPIVIPPFVAWVRRTVLTRLPPQLIPFALSIGGALAGIVAESVGYTEIPPDFSTLTAAGWEGFLLGVATIGVHQLVKQGRELWRKFKARRKERKESA